MRRTISLTNSIDSAEFYDPFFRPDWLFSNMCRRILVVVQCHSLADRIALRLEGLGHQVRIACDGQAALVVAGNLHPDVVLLDATMGNVSGCEVAALCSLLGGQDIPIVTI